MISLETLGNLNNGRLGHTVDEQIGKLLKDCYERALLEKPRTLTLKLSLTPTPDMTLSEVKVSCESSIKLPPSTTLEERSKVELVTDNLGHATVEAKLPAQGQLFSEDAA